MLERAIHATWGERHSSVLPCDFYKDWPDKIDNSGTNVMGIASYFLMLPKTELMPGFLKVIKLEVSLVIGPSG